MAGESLKGSVKVMSQVSGHNRLTTASLILADARWASDQAVHRWATMLALSFTEVSKLRLDGSVVDVVLVEHSPDISHDTHEIVLLAEQDMNTGDVLRLGQLPDVQLMDRDNAIDGRDVLPYVLEVDGLWDTLQEDEGSRLDERESRREDNAGDNEGNDWIRVVPVLPGRKPNDQTRADDSNIPEGIAHNMENKSSHVHRTMAMAMLRISSF